jgi:hypothetical protein
MSKYQMEDGTIVNTEKAKKSWTESTRFDGRNQISVNTGSQWNSETLYESRKGRFYVEHESAWQGSTSHAEWVSEYEAVRWLLLNKEEVPERLLHLVDEVEE